MTRYHIAVPAGFLLLAWLFSLLGGCAALGLPTAQSFDERLSAGYAANTAVREAATDLLLAKKISSSDGQHVLDTTRSARTGLDVARSLKNVDPKGADAKLKAQRAVIDALKDYLRTKGGG